jgi:hypothetical protein
MKSTKTIKALLLSVAALTAPLLANASLIWYDGFTYTNGSLAVTNVTSTNYQAVAASGGLWVRESGSASPDDMYVVNSNLQVTATGGGASGVIISRQDDCTRYFASTTGTTGTNILTSYASTAYDTPLVLYASFTVICSTAISNNAGLPNGPGSYFASFYSGTNYYNTTSPTNITYGYGYCGRVQAFTNGAVLPGTWRIGVTDNTLSTNLNNGGFPVDLAVNTPYHVVEEIDPITLQACTIWVNPINPNQTGASPVDTHYTANDSMGKMLTYGVNGYSFRQPSTFGNAAFMITNLAIATTFVEALTNVAPTNALPPTIVYQPLGTTNFVGSSFTLSALANGQGLGSMTYQWQLNGANVTDGSGGNANIFTVSSANTTDSGNYTLIATTPYGLSTTSSVAIVSISGGTNPPHFSTQPASTTLYAGQSTTLSCSVISPGSVAFTWYSNNVVVTGQQNDSGDTSTFTPVTASSANTATYKVAATNSVNVIGVVSTNAVVTVNNPSAVSVLYLRQLVASQDPANYQATVTLTPYQVTGTITTATNLTSGNTSSYYLQDATAGINIFATFGSTFRPAQGDVVTFVGVLSSYSSGLELYADTTTYPYTSYVDTGTTNALPAPLVIPFTITNSGYANMNTNIAGRYVQLTNVFFGTNSSKVIGSGFYSVTNGLGQSFNLWFSAQDSDTMGQTLPTYAQSVSGVVFGSMNPTAGIPSPNFAVAVTKFSDIVTNPPTVLPIPLTAAFAGGGIGSGITFNWTDTSYDTGYVLQTATNLLGPWTVVTGAASGFTTNVTSAPAVFYRLYHP